MSQGKPFPPLLMWALVLSLTGLLLSGLVGAVSRGAGGVLAFASLLVQLVAVPIAIRLLMSGGHRTTLNIVLTVLAAIPWTLLVVGVISTVLGLTRFHI